MNPLYEEIAKNATAEQIAEGRRDVIDWGCDEGNDPDQVDELVAGLSDAEVARLVDRRWDGGWQQFTQDIVPVEVVGLDVPLG
jgi:hypothetical protein